MFAVSSGCSPQEQKASPKLWVLWRASQNVGMGGRTGAIGRQISFTACSRTPIEGSSLYLVLCHKQTQATSASCSQALARKPDMPKQRANRAGRLGEANTDAVATRFQELPSSKHAQGTEPPLPLQVPQGPWKTEHPPICTAYVELQVWQAFLTGKWFPEDQEVNSTL